MAGLRCLDLRPGRAKGEQDLEGAAFAQLTGYVNAAVMFFHDAAHQRESESGAVAASCVEGPEDLCNLLFGNAAARVGDGNTGAVVLRSDDHAHGSRAIDGLHGVEQIQNYLMNL